MALLDISRRVLTAYKADTNDMERGIDRLVAANRRLSDSTKAAARSQSDHFDQIVLGLTRSSRQTDNAAMSWEGYTKASDKAKAGHTDLMGTFAKGAAVVGTMVAAYELATDALKSYGESLRLESKTAGINIDQLSKSFDGLVDRHDILTFASQTMRGQLRLNQQEMNTVAQAAVTFRDRGYDLTEALDKLKDAAVKGKVEGLDDLGLSIKQGSSKAETLRNLMTELNKVIDEGATSTNKEANAVDQLGVSWNNAAASAKNYAAQALLAAGGAVDTDAARGYVYAHDANNPMSALLKARDEQAARVRYQQGMDQFNKGIASGRQGVVDSQLIEMPDLDLGSDISTRRQTAQETAKKLADEARKLADRVSKELTDALAEQLQQSVDEDGQTAAREAMAGIGAGQVDLSSVIQGIDKQSQATLRNDKTNSFLEKTFGSVDEYSTYATAFGNLSNAISGSYEAIVTGAEPAGQAFKKMIASGLLATGKSEAVQALKEGAWAIGDLAYENFVGASQHGISAAEHAAAAIAAGIAARELGAGSGGAASAPKGGAAPSGASSADGTVNDHRTGATGQQQTQAPAPMIFVVGEHFAEMSPRQKAQEAEATVRRALGSTGGRNS